MKLETPKAITTASVLMAAGKKILMAKTINIESKSPIKPPITERTTDSAKN